MRNTFGRQAIAMIWDFAESNPFSDSSGSYDNMLNWMIKCIENLPASNAAMVIKQAAQTDNGLRNIMVSTDPPYYDNIIYADLSDFFYVWLRQSLKNIYPDIFQTVLVPKTEEIVAAGHRFEGGKKQANAFFEDGMLKTFRQIHSYVRADIPLTVYYAYKQSEDDGENISSTGWETMLSAIISAGFTITGTLPMRTELSNRMIGIDTNALASSIVLVCRKRPSDAQACSRRDFINELKRELKTALQKLQSSNLAPVDLAQSAISPGMGVFSRFSKVLEADGKAISVRQALQIINQELGHFLAEQDGDLDADSRFCIDLYSQYAFGNVKFGDADVLARAKNTSVKKLENAGVLEAQKGIVRLKKRNEISMEPSWRTKTKSDDGLIWLLTQQLTHALSIEGIEGAAKIIAAISSAEPDQAKSLAYRLFTIAQRNAWTDEAYAYNNLVAAWNDVKNRVNEIRAEAKQEGLFD